MVELAEERADQARRAERATLLELNASLRPDLGALEGAVSGAPTSGPTAPAVLPRGQWRLAGRPHGRLGADPHDVRNVLGGQRIAKRGHDAIAGIGDDGRGRDALARESRDLLERDLPFRAERDGVGDAHRPTPAAVLHPRLEQVEPIRRRNTCALVGHRHAHRPPDSSPACPAHRSTGARRRPSGSLSSGSRCRRRPTLPPDRGAPGPRAPSRGPPAGRPRRPSRRSR